MRVLLVSYFYPPSIGGVERQSHHLARELVARGHSVHVITARVGASASREMLDGVMVERVSAGGGSRWRRMATFLMGMLVSTLRARGRIDIIQVQQTLYPAITMALLSPLLGRPLVVRNSGSGAFGGVQLMRRLPLGRRGLKLLGARAVGVSLNDEMSAEMRAAGFERIIKIPNGVELPATVGASARAAMRAAQGLAGFVALYVGRLDHEKGIDVLIRAWSMAAVPHATLVVLGDGPRRSELEQLAASNPHSSQTVQFRGAVDEVSSYYGAADLFVLPSRSEGLSNALLEAMAHALPVIATDVGGNREVIVGDELGWLVPPNDSEALACALRVVIADAQLRAQRGAAARAHVEQRYSMLRTVDAYEQLFTDVLSRRPGHRSAVSVRRI